MNASYFIVSVQVSFLFLWYIKANCNFNQLWLILFCSMVNICKISQWQQISYMLAASRSCGDICFDQNVCTTFSPHIQFLSLLNYGQCNMSNVFGFKSRKRKLVCICGKVNHHLKRGQLILSRDVFLLRDFISSLQKNILTGYSLVRLKLLSFSKLGDIKIPCNGNNGLKWQRGCKIKVNVNHQIFLIVSSLKKNMKLQ